MFYLIMFMFVAIILAMVWDEPRARAIMIAGAFIAGVILLVW